MRTRGFAKDTPGGGALGSQHFRFPGKRMDGGRRVTDPGPRRWGTPQVAAAPVPGRVRIDLGRGLTHGALVGPVPVGAHAGSPGVHLPFLMPGLVKSPTSHRKAARRRFGGSHTKQSGPTN